jgi:uncharacterized membrane protein
MTLPKEQQTGRSIGVGAVFLWFAIGGAAHFLATNLEASIVPPYIPWHRATVLVTGVFEWLGAAGVLCPRGAPRE